jgi:hypothetical protein
MHLCLPHLAHQHRYTYFGLFALLVFDASAATPPDYSKEGVVIQQFAKNSGSDALKSAREALLKVHYDMPFPDGGPERIARRGILSCSTYTSPSCQFVLLLPSTTRK